ncbi:unnamed protein product, partial [Didymodactylos carnosus]
MHNPRGLPGESPSNKSTLMCQPSMADMCYTVPLIALCCLGILGFLLVATIVLALIPVYLPKRAGGTVAVEANQ